jgi:hypothetical protein
MDEIIVGRLVLEPSDVKGIVPPGRLEVRGIQIAIVYWFLVLALGVVHAVHGTFDLRIDGWQLLGGLFFLLPAAIARAALTVVERNWLKGYAQRPLDTEYKLSPAEVRVTNHARDFRIKFSLVRSYIEQTSHFVLYGGGRMVLEVVPKRAFAEDELSRLRALLVERLEPASFAVLTVTPRLLFRPLLWTLLVGLGLFVATFIYVFVTQY